MYNVTEFKICDRVEKMRLNSIKEINEEASDIRQDNEDLAMLKIIYEHLQLSDHDRAVVDDYIFCLKSRAQRMEQHLYYAGMMDSVNL